MKLSIRPKREKALAERWSIEQMQDPEEEKVCELMVIPGMPKAIYA